MIAKAKMAMELKRRTRIAVNYPSNPNFELQSIPLTRSIMPRCLLVYY
jgi:hypothetical protein